MRHRFLSPMLSLVNTSTVRIEIEAHVGDDEICGQIGSDAGPAGSFSGWLGLIAALDALFSQGPGARPRRKRPQSAKRPDSDGEDTCA